MDDVIDSVDRSEVENRCAVFFPLVDLDIDLKRMASKILFVEDSLEPLFDSVGIRSSELSEEFLLRVILDISQIDLVKAIVTFSHVVIGVDSDIEVVAFNLLPCLFVEMTISEDKACNTEQNKENKQYQKP